MDCVWKKSINSSDNGKIFLIGGSGFIEKSGTMSVTLLSDIYFDKYIDHDFLQIILL